MIGNADDGDSRTYGFVYFVAVGGVGIALLLHFLLPPTQPAPLDPRDVVGCYGANRWPDLIIGQQWFAVHQPGFAPQRYGYERGKDWNHLTLETGLKQSPDGSPRFATGSGAYLPRVRFDSEGKERWTTEEGPAQAFSVAGVIYKRTPCPKGTTLR